MQNVKTFSKSENFCKVSKLALTEEVATITKDIATISKDITTITKNVAHITKETLADRLILTMVEEAAKPKLFRAEA